MEHTTFKKIAFFTLTAGALVASQSVLAHTRLQTSTTVEGTTVYNNATIGHGCAVAVGSPAGTPRSPVIANSMIFPDGTDSTVSIGGAVVDGAIVDDYIAWGGKISHIPSKDVFEKSSIERGRAGLAGANAVGNHSWDGKLNGDNYVGLVPIRISGAFINPDSCANTVTFRVAIADICKITNVAGFSDQTVDLWTPAVGSVFDGVGLHGYNSPATYKITRNLVTSPLPATGLAGEDCGAGVDVVIDPSAAQLDHDMPIPGVWPRAKK
jgi:hypothetical protein